MKTQQIKQIVNSLDPNKIHILFFSYRLSFKNIYHSPLLLFSTKPLALLTGSESIDHVCHISRFIPDEEGQFARLFEAGLKGMEQNDLQDRLEHFDGTLWIQTLGNVNRVKAKIFEMEYLDQPYSKINAFNAGVDGWLGKTLKKLLPKSNNLFCSWLVGLFLESQSYAKKDWKEQTPSDIFYLSDLKHFEKKKYDFKN